MVAPIAVKASVREVSDLFCRIQIMHTLERILSGCSHYLSAILLTFFNLILPGDLNRHLRSIHLQMKPILCPCCNRKFAKQETLLRHLNTAHRNKSGTGSGSSVVAELQPNQGPAQDDDKQTIISVVTSAALTLNTNTSSNTSSDLTANNSANNCGSNSSVGNDSTIDISNNSNKNSSQKNAPVASLQAIQASIRGEGNL